jgi:hypothetical protein
MRSGILRRIRLLEARLPENTTPAKKILPEWLIEDLADQGIPCDEVGMPDWEVVNRLSLERSARMFAGRIVIARPR